MKHKHYDLIMKWANGAKVQYSCGKNIWFNTNTPEWDEDTVYRIVPEPKPDIHTYLTINYMHTGKQTLHRFEQDTVKFTYDGETKTLKSVELLK